MLDDAYKLEKCVKIALLYLEVNCLFLSWIWPHYTELSSHLLSSSLLTYAPLLLKSSIVIVQDDDAINAEIFIKKASFLVNNCKDEALNLQYKVRLSLSICHILCKKKVTSIPVSRVWNLKRGEKNVMWLFSVAGMLCSYSGLKAQVLGGSTSLLRIITIRKTGN